MATQTTRHLPDSTEITVRWAVTCVEEYEHTLTLGELREALRTEGGQHRAADTDPLADDLGVLENSWLGGFEQDAGSLIEFNREIQAVDGFVPVELADFTVTIAGTERHDGEAPYTYCVEATDMQQAREIVYDYFVEQEGLDIDPENDEYAEPDVEFVEGEWNTFPGAPSWPASMPGRAWNDLRGQTRALWPPIRPIPAPPAAPGAPDRPGPARPKQAPRGPKGPKNRSH